MGGLVCMRYILDQLERNQVPPILGLLLYGTPATGSDLIKIARLVGFGIGIKLPPVRWLVNLFLKSQRQITDLATGSRFLTSLQANWVYRVINGGHESAAPGRMWLPVCVVTAEDDVFVSEESGKGLYGAIDWRPLPFGHVQLVKPSLENDERYIAAKRFLRICRNLPSRDVLSRLLEASRQIWKSRDLRVSQSLKFHAIISDTPVQTLPGFGVCETSCEYRMLLEENVVAVGITISDQARQEVWSRALQPLYVHQNWAPVPAKRRTHRSSSIAD
jgi:hypothetical protein